MYKSKQKYPRNLAINIFNEFGIKDFHTHTCTCIIKLSRMSLYFPNSMYSIICWKLDQTLLVPVPIYCNTVWKYDVFCPYIYHMHSIRSHHGYDCMVDGFKTTYAISAYTPLMLWVRIPFMVRCIRYNIMWCFLQVLRFPTPKKNITPHTPMFWEIVP